VRAFLRLFRDGTFGVVPIEGLLCKSNPERRGHECPVTQPRPPGLHLWYGLTSGFFRDQISYGNPSTRASGTANKIPLPGSQRSPHSDTSYCTKGKIIFRVAPFFILNLEGAPELQRMLGILMFFSRLRTRIRS
jgi:hypothetical protein